MFLGKQGVSAVCAICDAMSDVTFQEERYEEEEDERILCSSFSPGQNADLFELPDSEALFMPTDMDSSQMVFKFKEVSHTHTMTFSQSFSIFLRRQSVINNM